MDQLNMTTSPWHIRKGERRDLPAALELVRELAAYVNAPDAVRVSVADMERDGFGRDPLYGFFVAEGDGGDIVGLALFYYRYSTWKGKRMYLEDLVVTRRHRGEGLGKKLFDAVIREGISTQCTGMMWQVVDSNTNAQAFYREKYGALIEENYHNCSLTLPQMKHAIGATDH